MRTQRWFHLNNKDDVYVMYVITNVYFQVSFAMPLPESAWASYTNTINVEF